MSDIILNVLKKYMYILTIYYKIIKYNKCYLINVLLVKIHLSQNYSSIFICLFGIQIKCKDNLLTEK